VPNERVQGKRGREEEDDVERPETPSWVERGLFYTPKLQGPPICIAF